MQRARLAAAAARHKGWTHILKYGTKWSLFYDLLLYLPYMVCSDNIAAAIETAECEGARAAGGASSRPPLPRQSKGEQQQQLLPSTSVEPQVTPHFPFFYCY